MLYLSHHWGVEGQENSDIFFCCFCVARSSDQHTIPVGVIRDLWKWKFMNDVYAGLDVWIDGAAIFILFLFYTFVCWGT